MSASSNRSCPPRRKCVEIEKTLVSAAPPARVWELLLDPNVMGACVPGMASIEVLSEVEYIAHMAVKIAFINARFRLHTKIVETRAPHYLRTEGTGEDASVASSLRWYLRPGRDEDQGRPHVGRVRRQLAGAAVAAGPAARTRPGAATGRGAAGGSAGAARGCQRPCGAAGAGPCAAAGPGGTVQAAVRAPGPRRARSACRHLHRAAPP
ncbi:hypothetical protein CBM2589_A30047 [Cupriavidus taiwanensis]|uniref:Carbon monoxide dehydrogenase subunit G n=1 Tax=Cupriavidus taiwanensis TaxID=164546 RepID=A0A976A5J0_9BURK|nr:hypothetical protein CBM2589_A30047 [Cupriavidus taiwanensis]